MQSQDTTSFFDDETNKLPFKFTKPTQAHQNTLHNPPILSDTFTCKDISTSNSKPGVFALHNELLAYYQNGLQEAPTTVLDINYAKVRSAPISLTNRYAIITLTKNGCSYEFTFPDNQMMENWVLALKNFGVMTNFHDDYKASKMIGRGSFAKVFLVESKAEGKQFAVKAFPKEATGGEANRLKFQRTMINEINIMRCLTHENIIRLYEVHETERSLYLIMELIEGKPLQSPLARMTLSKDFSEKAIIEMFRSILDALAYVESKGIMHRDLKPDNILLDKTGKLKIADFGLATFINEPEYIFKKCGTPGYIAPEVFKYDPQVASTHYNAKCDVFSAGCILYYMLFGNPLFDGTKATEVLDMNKTYSDIQVIHQVKKEMKNPLSRINKEGLNLLLQLLEIEQKKRVSASEALAHSYFLPALPSIQKFSSSTHIKYGSSKELKIDSSNSKNYIEITGPLSPLIVKKSQDRLCGSLKSELSENGPLTASRNRFTQKDSFYLDVGKPDFNGKVTTLALANKSNKSNNASFNYSLFIKPEENNKSASGQSSNSLNPKSMFQNQKKRRQSRSFKNFNTPTGGQSFLKAAIFNNMNHKKTEADDVEGDENDTEEGKWNGPGRERSHTDNNIPIGSDTSSSSSGSEDLDVGDEDNQIEVNIAKVKIGTSDKHSSKRVVNNRNVKFPVKKV